MTDGKLNIAEDVEYIRNQVNYLDTFSKKVEKECKNYFGFSNYWSGVPDNAPIYPHIEKWVINYQKLHRHVHAHNFEKEVMELVNQLEEVYFEKPSLTKYDLQSFPFWKKAMYYALIPYRCKYNSGKVKHIKTKIKEINERMEVAKKMVLRLEQHYFYS